MKGIRNTKNIKQKKKNITRTQHYICTLLYTKVLNTKRKRKKEKYSFGKSIKILSVLTDKTDTPNRYGNSVQFMNVKVL